MFFTLTINGDTPAEFLTALQQMGSLSAQLPQSAPVAQPEPPKCPTPTAAKKPAGEPATASAAIATPAKEVKPDPTPAPTSVPGEPQASTPAQTAPSEATVTAPSAEQEKDPAAIKKILDLARTLSTHGHQKECRLIVSAAGATSVSELPPASYTSVWEQLCKLKDEVDAHAAH